MSSIRILPLAVAVLLASCAPAPSVDCLRTYGSTGGCPEPYVQKFGSLQGFVFGGAGQPVPLAFVTTGYVSSYTGNPIESEAVSEESDDGRTAVVKHDFRDGQGQVLTERRLRKKAIVLSEQEEPDAARRAMKQKYVYLRAGEYLLEQVAEGISTLRASFGPVTSTENPVTVFANTTTTDVNLSLAVPMPTTGVETEAPRIVAVLGEETAVAVTLTPGTSWTAAPNEVPIALQAPSRSQGAVITALELAYHWSDGPTEHTETVERLPIPPKVVGAAQPGAGGPPALVPVPVLTEPIRRRLAATDTPEFALRVQVRFYDESGFHVLGPTLEPLVAELQLQVHRSSVLP